MTSASAPAPQPPTLREWVRTHDERWLFVVLYLGLAVGLSIFVSLFWLVVVAALHFALEIFRQRHYRANRRSVVLHALWEVKLDAGLVLLALTLVLYIEVVLGILGVQSAARAAAVSRAGARMGTRAAAWERNLRTFLLTVDEMVRVAHAGYLLRKKRREARLRQGGTDESATPSDAPTGSVDAVSVETTRGPSGGPLSGDATPPAPPAGDEVPDPGAPGDSPHGAPPLRLSPRPHAWRGPWKLGDRIGVGLVVAGVIMILVAPWITPHDWGSALAALAEELRPFPGS